MTVPSCASVVLALLVSSVAWRSSFSQVASVVGTVRDSASHAPISGAQVTILGSGKQRITGSDGTFRFDSVSPGTWQLRAVCLGCLRPPVVPLTLQAGQEVEIAIDVWHPTTRSDTCGIALELSRRRWEDLQAFVRDTVPAYTRRLGLPALADAGNGDTEIRFWAAWWLDAYNHLLWIAHEGDTVRGTLFRWWRDDPEWPVPRRLADAHREAGICEALWKDAGGFFCRIRLDALDVGPFLDSLAAHADDLRGRPSLPPPASGDCRLAIRVDPPTTLLEMRDAEPLPRRIPRRQRPGRVGRPAGRRDPAPDPPELVAEVSFALHGAFTNTKWD